MLREFKKGFNSDTMVERLILEPSSQTGYPEDYSDEEWAVICKVFNLDPNITERIVLREPCVVEYFITV